MIIRRFEAYTRLGEHFELGGGKVPTTTTPLELSYVQDNKTYEDTFVEIFRHDINSGELVRQATYTSAATVFCCKKVRLLVSEWSFLLIMVVSKLLVRIFVCSFGALWRLRNPRHVMYMKMKSPNVRHFCAQHENMHVAMKEDSTVQITRG